MAAPNATLLAALRAGTVARHLFFKMPHSSGDVYAWDGLGDFPLDGETYLGVGDLAEVSGVSASADVQSNAVTVTLHGVPRSALQNVGGVRGSTATIKAAWIAENGVVVASRTVFAGPADNMRSRIDADSVTVSIRVRAKMFDWSKAPASYYVPSDQQRLFAGDTGFDFVKEIEAGTTAGWSKTAEVTAARLALSFGQMLVEDTTNRVCGAAQFGPNLYRAAASPLRIFARDFDGAGVHYYAEQGTGAQVTVPSLSVGEFVEVGSNDCYIDVSGDARSPGGNLLFTNGATSERIRRQGTIASIGTATTDYLGTVTLATQQGGGIYFARNGVAPSAPFGRDWTNIVYSNDGRFVTNSSGVVRDHIGGAAYVEEGTGTSVTVGSNRMRVGGVDCVVSTTGAIRSPAGNYIIRQGSSSAAGAFLRLWT